MKIRARGVRTQTQTSCIHASLNFKSKLQTDRQNSRTPRTPHGAIISMMTGQSEAESVCVHVPCASRRHRQQVDKACLKVRLS